MGIPQHPYPLWHPVYWLCTWGHSGLSPKAPGTVGSIMAMVYGWFIIHYFGTDGLFNADIICFILGWLVSELYVRKTGQQDPKEVVIDEVAGMWLLLSFMPIKHINPFGSIEGGIHSFPVTAWIVNEPWSGVIMSLEAFILFRLFDIWKPWPVSWADKKFKGGFGIMLDDILAAIYALIAYMIIGVAKIWIIQSFW